MRRLSARGIGTRALNRSLREQEGNSHAAFVASCSVGLKPLGFPAQPVCTGSCRDGGSNKKIETGTALGVTENRGTD